MTCKEYTQATVKALNVHEADALIDALTCWRGHVYRRHGLRSYPNMIEGLRYRHSCVMNGTTIVVAFWPVIQYAVC